MDEFVHIRVIIGMILGLGLTHLIKGSAGFIQHPGRKKIYGVHLFWVFYIFLLLIHFWWWEFNLKLLGQWYFLDYFFVICYALIFFMICALLYPDDLKGYEGYKDYFYSRKKWFFALLGLCFLADLIDTLIKGTDYFIWSNTEYYLRIASHVLLCLLAIAVNNKTFHKWLVVVFIIYEILFIFRFYNLEV